MPYFSIRLIGLSGYISYNSSTCFDSYPAEIGLLLVVLLLEPQTKHEILAVLALDYYKRHYQVVVAAINITHPVKHGESL
jgi:hypothetical protein